MSLLVQVQEEATAKYKKIASFAFPFLILIIGSLFLYNVYLIETEDQLGNGGPSKEIRFFLLFFCMFILTIPFLWCVVFIVGDADKVNIEICSR